MLEWQRISSQSEKTSLGSPQLMEGVTDTLMERALRQHSMEAGKMKEVCVWLDSHLERVFWLEYIELRTCVSAMYNVVCRVCKQYIYS